MQPPVINLNLNVDNLNNGVTQSELSLMDECTMKWNLRYNNQLSRTDHFEWYFFRGHAWHAFQEEWRKTKGNCDITKVHAPEIPKGITRTSEFEKTLEYWHGILPALQEMYVRTYKEEAKHEWRIIEQELQAEHLGVLIRGKIDLASDKPKFIRDFKTTSSAWLISPDGWHFKLQFMIYCWLMSKNEPEWAKTAFDFQLDIMQQPALKETKADGSWAGHIRRVAADIKSRPEFYLKRIPARIEPRAIQNFEDTVLTPKIQRLLLVRDNPEETLSVITNPNTNACNSFGNRCEFFENCEKGWNVARFFFERRATKHQEL